MYRTISIFACILLALVWLLSACTTPNNSLQQIPTYVHIDSFSFNASTPPPGVSPSHQITQVWAYYNNNPVGVFDLPVTFPVITSGSSGQLELEPGIVVGGMNDFLASYAFYSFSTTTLPTAPGQTINIQPSTGYYGDVKNTIIFNYEDPYLRFGLVDGNVYMSQSPDSDNYEGRPSGQIKIGSPADTSIDTSVAFSIPAGTAFVEFNYKSDLQFSIGIQANQASVVSTSSIYLAGVNPSVYWQKFYISVADFAAQYPATSYNLYLRVCCSPGITGGTLVLNNFQLLHY
jgi:hypothetical protein